VEFRNENEAESNQAVQVENEGQVQPAGLDANDSAAVKTGF
jgi:hypothetical protein